MRIHSIGATLAFCIVGAAVAIAASPQIGSWKLNEAKSKLSGTARNHLVVYTEAGDTVTVAIDGVDASGKAFHSQWTGKFDGKAYPVTGDATSDSRSYKIVDADTLSFQALKGGKVTLSGTIAVSADGKSRTVTTNTTNASGGKVTQTVVYDRQ